jgi:nucleoside 2-deoxyribosyltransferase
MMKTAYEMILDNHWREKIYLACPYTSDNKETVEYRVECVDRVAAALMASGKTVFSPLSGSHPISKHVSEGGDTWGFWERQDVPFLMACDKIVVLMLDGWEDSCGVTDEVAIAKEIGIEVEYITLDQGLNSESR